MNTTRSIHEHELARAQKDLQVAAPDRHGQQFLAVLTGALSLLAWLQDAGHHVVGWCLAGSIFLGTLVGSLVGVFLNVFFHTLFAALFRVFRPVLRGLLALVVRFERL